MVLLEMNIINKILLKSIKTLNILEKFHVRCLWLEVILSVGLTLTICLKG